MAKKYRNAIHGCDSEQSVDQKFFLIEPSSDSPSATPYRNSMVLKSTFIRLIFQMFDNVQLVTFKQEALCNTPLFRHMPQRIRTSQNYCQLLHA